MLRTVLAGRWRVCEVPPAGREGRPDHAEAHAGTGGLPCVEKRTDHEVALWMLLARRARLARQLQRAWAALRRDLFLAARWNLPRWYG